MGRLRLGLQAKGTTQPGLPSCRTSQLSCWTSSSRGLRAWRDAVPPLARVFSSFTSPSTVSPSSTSCSTLASCSLTTTTACAPAAPQLASVQGDRHAEDRGCPRRQPKQPESLRLWRSDRMWTPAIITTAISTTTGSWVRDDLTVGRQTRQTTWIESDAFITSNFVQTIDPGLICLFASIR
jgi:hypothetical protein